MAAEGGVRAENDLDFRICFSCGRLHILEESSEECFCLKTTQV